MARPCHYGGMTKRRQQGTGNARQLPSGRWQARFNGPDGEQHAAPTTFLTKQDASAWLDRQRRAVASGTWTKPTSVVAGSVLAYSTTWLALRDLKPRTRSEYAGLLRRRVYPTLGPVPLADLTPSMVRAWHGGLGTDSPTDVARAYGLLHAICETAVDDEVIPANPCRVRGATTVKRRSKVVPATAEEVDAIAAAMPDRLACMIHLAAWTALRSGEIRELRRGDVAADGSRVTIDRAVGRVSGEGYVVGTPKSDAGIRSVAVPPHVRPLIVDHLRDHVGPDDDALLFPSTGKATRHLSTTTLYSAYTPAREAAGRPDLKFHHLRHTGATMAASRGGATLAEAMRRLGHSTPSAALIYQHGTDERDEEIAAAMSEHYENVIPMKRKARA